MKSYFIGFGLFWFCHYGLAQLHQPLTAKQIFLLDSIAKQDVPEKAPGIATAVVVNGTVIFEKSAGYASFADSSFISNQTRFNIASNGKQFTALAVLDLVDQKKLALNDDIRKWFPNLFKQLKTSISVRSLLTHTSGIRDCYDLWSLQGYTWWKQSFNNQDVLSLIEKQVELNFKPNSAYLYSNSNYILLALIIEKVSGQSFVRYTNSMFKRLKMPNTSFEDNFKTIKGPIAKSYFNFDSWTTYDWIWNVCGDGNIFSTLSDQIQWEVLVQGKGECDFNRQVIRESQQLVKGSKFKNYGYGLEFNQYKGMDYVFHEGATGAWKATVVRFPQHKTSIITLTNTGKSIPAMQTKQMVDILFNLKSDSAYFITKPSTIGSFVETKDVLGMYITENDFWFQFIQKNDQLYLKREGRNDVEIIRESNNIFHQKYDPAFKQEFIKDSNGLMTVTAYYTNHAPYSLKKIQTDWTDYNFSRINGTYLNEETNTTIYIQYAEANTYRIKFNKNNFVNGVLIAPNKLLVNGYSIDITTSETKAILMYLNGSRIKQLKYTLQP